jgi:hypothetical protein
MLPSQWTVDSGQRNFRNTGALHYQPVLLTLSDPYMVRLNLPWEYTHFSFNIPLSYPLSYLPWRITPSSVDEAQLFCLTVFTSIIKFMLLTSLPSCHPRSRAPFKVSAGGAHNQPWRIWMSFMSERGAM